MMKTKITVLIFLIVTGFGFSQNKGINYKALIKDNNGNVVANDLVVIQFTILEGAGMSNVYQETHTSNTDVSGIVIVNIGEGVVNSGNYNTIDWSGDEHYLNVKINTGGGLTDMGTTQFMAVPYALSAANAATKIDDLTDGKSDNDGSENGSSIFIGTNAGSVDDGTDNKNVGVGFEALKNNTTGLANNAFGYQALMTNTTGSYNTALGSIALQLNTTGIFNTALGGATLLSNTTGSSNVAVGTQTLLSNTEGSKNTATGVDALYTNTTGSENVANGYQSLYNNSIGINNTANGYQSLYSNNNGHSNTANGYKALYFNTTGFENTATGLGALYSNTDGDQNTANGFQALYSNTTGTLNVANGFQSLYSNTTGNANTANGYYALYTNIDGYNNVAIGGRALRENISGDGNTATGVQSLLSNTTGSENTGIGRAALSTNTTGNYNTGIGSGAVAGNITGWFNTGIGYSALNTLSAGSNNIGIGNNAQVPNTTGSNQVRIGDTFITYAGIQVAWTVTSDKRWKDHIRELPYGIEEVMQLKPVDYIRKNNENRTREIGFIAQDVEAWLNKIGYTDQGLLTKDDKGYISLRYNDFIALLTKAIQDQQEIIENQNKEIKSLTAELSTTKSNQISLDQRLTALEGKTTTP